MSNTDDLEQWSLGSKYSFFAYFPMTGVTVTDQNTVDAPRITYNLPLGTSPIDPDDLIDLMTAYSIDQTAKGSGQVDFTFQHRLFCISVLAQNFNNDVEEDDNVTTEADQTISDLKLTITNLKYEALTVPMQKGDGKIAPVYTPKSVDSDQKPVPFSATFDLSSSGSQTITVPSHDDYTGKAQRRIQSIFIRRKECHACSAGCYRQSPYWISLFQTRRRNRKDLCIHFKTQFSRRKEI